MIDTVLALFILWIIVFLVGLLRKGLVWSFLGYVIIITAWYSGMDIVLTVILLLVNTFSVVYMLRGEEEW